MSSMWMSLLDMALLFLLHPELVHAAEGCGVLGLELVPGIEIGHAAVVGKACAVTQRDRAIDLETKQAKPVGGEKRSDLRQRQAMLLNMEQQIATSARRIEIGRTGERGKRRTLTGGKDCLPCAANLVGAVAEAVLGRQSLRT